jgi:glycosyltransferase involved in cell wall biosynthesis
LKILQITPSYKPAFGYGGTITSIGLLCENLVENGHQITVITTTANGKNELPKHTQKSEKVAGVEVFYFPRWTGDHSHFSPALLWWLWRNLKKFEAIHIHSWWNLVAILSTSICVLRGIRPVISPRGMLSPFTLKNGKMKPLFHRFVGEKILEKTVLHATSTQECTESLALIPDWQHAVLPNFLDIPKIENLEKKIPSGTFQLLFLSRIHEKKGLKILFEALAKCPFDWSLTIAGDGDTAYIESLKKLSEKLRISLKINWLGWVDTDNRFNILQEADLLILPSHNENFANVVIESLAVGTPVLVSRYVGLWDYVTEKNLGWICDTTAESIEEKIKEAHAQITERQRISETSSLIVHQDFGPSVLVEKYIEMYQQIRSPNFN